MKKNILAMFVLLFILMHNCIGQIVNKSDSLPLPIMINKCNEPPYWPDFIVEKKTEIKIPNIDYIGMILLLIEIDSLEKKITDLKITYTNLNNGIDTIYESDDRGIRVEINEVILKIYYFMYGFCSNCKMIKNIQCPDRYNRFHYYSIPIYINVRKAKE